MLKIQNFTIRVYLFTLILLIGNYSLILACDCETSRFDLPEIEVFNSNSTRIIFKGMPTSMHDTIIDGEGYIYYNYTVLNSYLGTLPETINIFTRYSSDTCGFADKIGSKSIITAYLRGGKNFTAREDCAKTVSEHTDPKKFHQWDTYLTSIQYGIDGEYHLKQPASYYNKGHLDTIYNIPLLSYTIENSKLEGSWKLFSRGGDVIQSGQYVNGEKAGTWLFKDAIYEIDKVIIQTIRRTFYGGKLMKEVTEKEFRYF